MNDDNVGALGVAYQRMCKKWGLIEDLLGGTAAMQEAGQKWLPKEQAETDENYEARLRRSILFGMLKDTLTKLAAKPFARDVVVKGLPPQVQYILTNADGRGRTFTDVLYASFFDLMAYGLSESWVDYTPMPKKPDGSKATIAEEQKLGARAFIRVLKPTQVIGWRFVPNVAPPQLSVVRIHEERTEPVGVYRDQCVEYVWVLGSMDWELWRRDPDKDEWVIHKVGQHTFGDVPIFAAYADEGCCELEAEPPFSDLAYVNLAHYQSDSDQRNILRMCRFAILFLKGLTDEEHEDAEGKNNGKKLIVGPTNFVKTTNADADMKYVEHTGKAIEAGRQDLLDLEARGEKLGTQPLAQTSTTRTAAGANIDESRNLSLVQRWVRNIEAHGKRLLSAVLKWHGLPVPEDLVVDVYSDFKVTLYDDDDAKLLSTVTEKGMLTIASFLHELKRRGKLPEAFDVDAEVEALEELRAKMGPTPQEKPDAGT